MADSLLLCRLFELLGGGVPSQLPQCAGALFRLGDQYSFGTPQPVVDFVVSLIGDGSRPVGDRMDNRTIELPITIIVPNTSNPVADRLTLSAAREALFEAINVDQFELVWSPDGTDGTRELVYDCWKAKANTVDFNYKAEKQLTMTVTVTFDAYPWGRNDSSAKIAFDSPIIDPSQTPVYQLQDFENGASGVAISAVNTKAATNGPYDTAFTSVTLGSGATAQYSTAQVAHGSFSALINAGASSQSVKLAWGVPSAGVPTDWFRLYVYLTAAPTAAATLMTALTSGSATVANLKLNPDRTLSMDAGASSNVIATTNQIPLNQWVRIEGYVTGDTAAGQVSVSLYQSMDSGTALETVTSAATLNTAGVPASFQFGIINTGAGASWAYNLDDIAISANGPIGAYKQFGSGGTYVSQVTIDDFSTFGSLWQPTWWQQTTTTAQGSYAARWNHDISDKQSPMIYKRNLGTPINITGRDKIAMWLGMGVPSADFKTWHSGMTHYAITLWDSSGHSLVFGGQSVLQASNNPSWPYWNRLSLPIPQNNKTFRYESVIQWQIQAWSEQQVKVSGKYLHFKTTAYLAGVMATPAAGPKRPGSDRGGDYILYGIEGSAPSPLNLHAQLGYTTYVQSTQSFTLPGTPGSPSTWLAPSENPNWLGTDSADFDEYGTTGTWTGSDGTATNGTLANSTAQFNSGTASLSVVPVTAATNVVIASMPASGILTSGVPCAAGDRISLRANVKAGSTARSITLGAEFFDSSGTSIGRVNLTAVTDSSSAWTLISGRVTAPTGAAVCRMVATVATPAVGEVHYFDDFYLAWALQATVVCQGGGGAGGTALPSDNVGGGGGGGEIAWETNLDLNPAAYHAYTVGASGPSTVKPATKGGDGGASIFTGLSVTVTAHGGIGGTSRIAQTGSIGTGGSGGSGSTNTHHFNGGTGGTGNVANPGRPAGGGGGSAGDGGAGATGSGSTPGQGGAAGALGVPGASGGHANDDLGGAGNPGFNFGGGGGGAGSSMTRGYVGGPGGIGRIKIIMTAYSTQSNFPCFLVHKPSKRAGTLAQTVIPVGSGVDAPDGREYGVPSVDGFNARYNGTYSVYAVNYSWNGTTARTVTATVKQYESAGGAISSVAVAQSVTPASIVNGMVYLGEVTLPVKDMPKENIDSYFTASVQSSNLNDRFLDLLLIDTAGTFVLINLPGGGYTDYWIDAPDLQGDIGKVLGSVVDRQQAVSVLANTTMSGGPLMLNPGVNQFTVYSPTGQPGLAGEYIPHWWLERLY